MERSNIMEIIKLRESNGTVHYFKQGSLVEIVESDNNLVATFWLGMESGAECKSFINPDYISTTTLNKCCVGRNKK